MENFILYMLVRLIWASWYNWDMLVIFGFQRYNMFISSISLQSNISVTPFIKCISFVTFFEKNFFCLFKCLLKCFRFLHMQFFLPGCQINLLGKLITFCSLKRTISLEGSNFFRAPVTPLHIMSEEFTELNKNWTTDWTKTKKKQELLLHKT